MVSLQMQTHGSQDRGSQLWSDGVPCASEWVDVSAWSQMWQSWGRLSTYLETQGTNDDNNITPHKIH